MLIARKLLSSFLVCSTVLGQVLADTPVTEIQRIDYLIRSVEQLSDAKFVRNGVAYDGRAAAEHLRLKLREAGSRVKTADDFIRLCGSTSSVSGKPYQIQFADGRLITSEAFLRARLSEFQTPKK